MHPDSWTIPGTEIEIVRVSGGPRDGDYLFFPETVALLPEFHARAFTMPVIRQAALDNRGYELMSFIGPVFDHDLMESLPAPLLRPVLGTLV